MASRADIPSAGNPRGPWQAVALVTSGTFLMGYCRAVCGAMFAAEPKIV